jgi:hypothetical protein
VQTHDVPSPCSEASEIANEWARAEQRGDVGFLDELLDEGLVVVGPDGTVFDKASWLARYRSGDLVHHGYCWKSRIARRHPGALIIVGDLEAASSYRGSDATGRHAVSLTFVAREGSWRLASLQLTRRG